MYIYDNVSFRIALLQCVDVIIDMSPVVLCTV